MAEHRDDDRDRRPQGDEDPRREEHRRDGQHEQHRVVHEDDRGQPSVGPAEQEPDGPDDAGTGGQRRGDGTSVPALNPAPPGHERYADTGQERERGGRSARGEREGPGDLAVLVVGPEGVHRHHAEQGEAARGVHPDQPGGLLRRPARNSSSAVVLCVRRFLITARGRRDGRVAGPGGGALLVTHQIPAAVATAQRPAVGSDPHPSRAMPPR